MKRIVPILIAVIVLAGAGWWFWTTSPVYAVQQAAEAIKEHNVETFLQWVNVKTLADNTVEDLLAEPVKNSGGAGMLERVIGIAVVSVLKPMAVESMTKQIVRYVEHKPSETPEAPKGILGQFIAALKPPSLHSLFEEYGFTRKNYKGLGSFDVHGDISHVGIKFFSPKALKVLEVQFELDKSSGHWEIDKISNLQDLVRTLNANPGA